MAFVLGMEILQAVVKINGLVTTCSQEDFDEQHITRCIQLDMDHIDCRDW